VGGEGGRERGADRGIKNRAGGGTQEGEDREEKGGWNGEGGGYKRREDEGTRGRKAGVKGKGEQRRVGASWER